ncbi:3D (Asp-Asp-Asp) domain-containing protein [Prosthecobacter fusiformis]|uniref:3D (Asp-Asp-Asp) domain-containing protein n=1 Tax=Prosthecobacter fusiformis TaxID=48464 RepID=A0A4R7SQF8_9BACT|nr:3D domain-containing protein [Prosthecobacter fusiformis]TDU80875.1 3D (Asp-Asp-Asp) domain-containing protein [Prosthecobacter fusiformis]
MSTQRLFCWSIATVVAVFSLSSCALSPLELVGWASPQPKEGVPLQPGTRYEVRKALAAGVPFRPQELKRYYFVMDAPRPPLMAAAQIPGRRMTVRTTAYCHDEDDHIVYGVKNALGTPLKFGAVRSAAADWSRYPVGTRFRIAGQPDVVYEVDDYGSALVGTGTIDLYKPTQGMMNDWGVRHVDIEVLQWGSYRKSMEIMRERTRWPHVRRMVDEIETQVYQVTAEALRGPMTASL